MGVQRNRQRGTWQVQRRYQLRGTTQRIRRDFATKAEAVAYDRQISAMIREVQAAEELGHLPTEAAVAAAAQKTNFAAWWGTCVAYAEAHCRPTTVARKKQIGRSHLLPALGHRPTGAIRPTEIDALQSAWLAAGLSPSSVQRIRAELNWALERAVRLGEIQQNPLRRVDKPKVMQAEQRWAFLSFAEADAYLAAAAEESAVWHTLLLCALRSGLRRGELCGLRWDDVDLELGHLSVRLTRTTVTGSFDTVTGPPKSGRERSVGLTPQLRAALANLPRLGAFVFTDGGGAPIHPAQIRSTHARVLGRSGICRKVRFHDLRHTWASHLAMRGVPLAHIQQLGGWGSLQMVQRYAHLSRESVIGLVAVLEEPSTPTPRAGSDQQSDQQAPNREPAGQDKDGAERVNPKRI